MVAPSKISSLQISASQILIATILLLFVALLLPLPHPNPKALNLSLSQAMVHHFVLAIRIVQTIAFVCSPTTKAKCMFSAISEKKFPMAIYIQGTLQQEGSFWGVKF